MLGSSRRLVTLKRIQSHVTRAAFLDHTHHCSSSASSERKGLLGLRAPRLCLGAHSPPVWSFPFTCPAVSPGAPSAGAGCLLCPGKASMGRCKKQQVPVWPPTRSTEGSSCLLISSLWMGAGWVQGSHCVSWFSSHPSAAHGGVTKPLHTPLPGAQGSGGQAPPRIWGSPGQVPPQDSAPRNHVQGPSCRARPVLPLVKSGPEPPQSRT